MASTSRVAAARSEVGSAAGNSVSSDAEDDTNSPTHPNNNYNTDGKCNNIFYNSNIICNSNIMCNSNVIVIYCVIVI